MNERVATMQRLQTSLVIAIVCAAGVAATGIAAAAAPAVDLTYEVDRGKTNGTAMPLADLLTKVKVRVEPWGQVEQHESGIRVRVHDPKHADTVKRAIAGGGSFELRIVANTRDHAEIIAKAQAGKDPIVRDGGKVIARWIAIDKKLAAEPANYSDWTTRTGDLNDLEALVVEDSHHVTGAVLESARTATDQRGLPTVAFTLTAEGGNRMFNLTAENLPDRVAGTSRRLAMIVRGYILSAPAIQSVINRECEISGNFTPEETAVIAAALKASMPPLPLKLVRRENIEPASAEKQ